MRLLHRRNLTELQSVSEGSKSRALCSQLYDLANPTGEHPVARVTLTITAITVKLL